MTDHPETDSRGESGHATPEPVRLSPPPKVGGAGAGGASAAAARRARADRGLVYWLTALVFLILGATAFAVFVFLPGWVEERASDRVGAETSLDAAPPAPEGMSTEPVGDRTGPAAIDEPVSGGLAPEAQAPGQPTPPGREGAAEPKPREARRRDTAPPTASPPARPTPPVDPTVAAFNEAMTEGLARLDQGDLARAREAFERARSLRPGSAEADDGLARVEAERQLLAIADHRERAAAHDQRERWGDAAAEYAAVLALDPSVRFAQEGHEQSTARKALSDRLESHAAHPGRLVSDEVLADARGTLAEAREIRTPGPVLARQIERLAGQVAVAETPVRVVLLSDGKTDLLVFRVGRLGTFERRALELRPGSYPVVGTRDGYRDVRRTLEVVPDKGEITLTVRCEEKI